MPAREMFFTFDTKIKINKKTVLQFINEFKDCISKHFKDIKKEFKVDAIDVDFLEQFVKELKAFDCVSIKERECHHKQKIIKEFVYDMILNETKEPRSILGIRYLYDEWDYEGCGSEDYYYLTYTDEKKVIKKYIKEAEKAVDKLKQMGVKVQFSIDE